MYKKYINLIFIFTLVSFVASTEVFDYLHQEPLSNSENAIQSASFLIFSEAILGHSCNMNSNYSHVSCHSDHFCKAEIRDLKIFMNIFCKENYSDYVENIYNSPCITRLLRPPIFV